VWMSAGLISYQLCDREFACEQCPLDIAIRKQHRAPDTVRGPTFPYASSRVAKKPLPKNILYSRHHCWISSMNERCVRIGIESMLAAMLLSLKTIVFPAVGETLRRNQRCVWFVLDEGTLPIVSPVEGTVHTINIRVKNNPLECCLHPFEHGWLWEMDVENKALRTAGLLNSLRAESMYDSDAAAFFSLVRASLKENANTVGLTLADGGILLPDLSHILGAQKYCSLLRKIFC